MRMSTLFAIVSSGVVLFLASTAAATQISPVTGHGWPNERTSGQFPSEAVDGNLGTFTWTTQSGNQLPAHLGLDFSSAQALNRIRLWKDDASGSGAVLFKDLTILYTTDNPATSIDLRTFQPVTGLTNGFLGAELMDATTVNSNGTVLGDGHDSVGSGEGWASLTFDVIPNATGVAIRFVIPGVDLVNSNHYNVAEFEAHFEQSLVPAVPEPSTMILAMISFVVLGCLGDRRMHRREVY